MLQNPIGKCFMFSMKLVHIEWCNTMKKWTLALFQETRKMPRTKIIWFFCKQKTNRIQNTKRQNAHSWCSRVWQGVSSGSCSLVMVAANKNSSKFKGSLRLLLTVFDTLCSSEKRAALPCTWQTRKLIWKTQQHPSLRKEYLLQLFYPQ